MAKASDKKMDSATLPTVLAAAQFIERLQPLSSEKKQKEYERHFQTQAGGYGEGDQFIGVQMGEIFKLAKEFIDMPLGEVETLLESAIHEVRVGGVSIMDFQARRKKTPAEERKALYDLYLRRHDRINNWDLVDRAAPYVVGGYLFDKPRDVLYELARSENLWERRTAIVSTYYFIRQNDLNETFNIAELLLNDEHDLIHKATGSWLREAGKKDERRLLDFLDEHAATMPRAMLRYTIEKLEKDRREYYRQLGKPK